MAKRIRLRCPECGKEGNGDPRRTERESKCPTCGESVIMEACPGMASKAVGAVKTWYEEVKAEREQNAARVEAQRRLAPPPPATNTDADMRRMNRAADTITTMFAVIGGLQIIMGVLGMASVFFLSNAPLELRIATFVTSCIFLLVGVIIYSFRIWIMSGTRLFCRGVAAAEVIAERTP